MYGSVSYIVRRPLTTRSPGKGTAMTNMARARTPDHPAPVNTTTQAGVAARQPPLDGDTQTGSIRRAGLLAGATLLALAVISAVAVLVVLDGLITPGDVAATATDIRASEGTFRLAVAGLYVVVVLDLVVAWALFRFLAPVNAWIARLAAWLRVAYAVVFLVAISQLAAVPDMLSVADYQGAFGEQQLQAQAMLKLEAFNHTWMAALLLFGAHLAVLGYLTIRSGYVPRVIGVLLVIAGSGYVVDTVSSVLSADPVVISTFTWPGEFLLAVWLVVRSRQVQRGAGYGV